jgi:hypothetical protein
MIEGRKNGSARGMLEEKTATENKRGEERGEKKRGAAVSLYESLYTQDDEDGSTSGGGSL